MIYSFFVWCNNCQIHTWKNIAERPSWIEACVENRYFVTFILVINQLDVQNLFYNKFISCLYMFRAPCAHRQEVKIALYSRAHVERVLSHPVHGTATYRFDDTRGCRIQFWPPDDEHMCSKHVEAWNKLIVKQSLCIKLVNY